MAQTTIQGSFLGDATVTGAKIGADFISAQDELTTTLATTDEIIVSDNGVIKRIDISVWSASTETFTNKTFDADGTGNSLTNIEVANLKSGVLDIDLSNAAGTDTTLASAKAIKAALDLKASIATPTFTTSITIGSATVTQAQLEILDGATVTTTELNRLANIDYNVKTEVDLKAPLASPVFTTSIKITAASAPGSPTEGQIYYNSTDKQAYIWTGDDWFALNSAPVQNATGGNTISSAISGYKYHIFTSGGTFTPSISGNVDYLVVAGGGGSGRGTGSIGGNGGGGAGGFRTGTAFAVLAQAYTITVGDGGAGQSGSSGFGGDGDDSVFSTITSTGGGGSGGGANPYGDGRDGGSGGGAGGGNDGGAGNTPSTSPSQGNNGGGATGGTGAGGTGGGGAGAAGADSDGNVPGAGGAGENNIMGMNDSDSYSHLGTLSLGHNTGGARYFAGGGGGGPNAEASGAAGGVGGGGNGATGGNGTNGAAGTANTGGGAGAQGYNNINGLAGGSGIVIIRYAV